MYVRRGCKARVLSWSDALFDATTHYLEMKKKLYRKEKLTYDSTRRSSAMKYWQLPYNLSYNRQGTTFLKCAGTARRGTPGHKGHAQGQQAVHYCSNNSQKTKYFFLKPSGLILNHFNFAKYQTHSYEKLLFIYELKQFWDFQNVANF